MKRILAVNQRTAFLFRSVLDALAASGFDVHLLTGSFENEMGYVPAFRIQLACKLMKVPSWRRIATWTLFTLQAAAVLVKHRECMAIIVTNPPLTPWIAPMLKHLFGIRYIELIYDVYPDVMERIGMIRPGGYISKCLKWLSAKAHMSADHVITLSDDMKQTILNHISKKANPPAVTVISNWADNRFLRPLSKYENPFAKDHDIVDKFVVMYSGNFGASHDIPNIVATAKLLEDLPGLRFVLIGDGTKEQEVLSLVRKLSPANLIFLQRQPVDKMPFSLACADCHIVSQDVGLTGISVPAKTFSALAVGAVIIGIAPPGTQIQYIIEKYHCGILVPPRSSAELAQAIRMLYKNPALCKTMRANSRLASETEFNEEVCTSKYVNLLSNIVR